MVFALVATAQVPTKETPNYIVVNGKAIQKVVPDEIYISIILIEGDGRNELTIVQQEEKLKKGLTDAGIDLSNLKVVDAYGNMQNRILGKDKFKEKKEYMLMVGTALEVSKVFEVADKQGVDDVRINHVDHSKITEYRKQVRIEAIKAAKEKAEYTLDAIGQKCGTPLSIREVSNTPRYEYNAPMFNNFIQPRGYSSGSTTVLQFDEIVITCEFEVYFQIQ